MKTFIVVLVTLISLFSFAQNKTLFTLSGKIINEPKHFLSNDKSYEYYDFSVRAADSSEYRVNYTVKNMNYTLTNVIPKKDDNFSASGKLIPPTTKVGKYGGVVYVNQYTSTELQEKFAGQKKPVNNLSTNPTAIVLNSETAYEKELIAQLDRELKKIEALKDSFLPAVNSLVESYLGCKKTEFVKPLVSVAAVQICKKDLEAKTKKYVYFGPNDFELGTFENNLITGIKNTYRYHDQKLKIESLVTKSELTSGKMFHPNGKVYTTFRILPGDSEEDEIFFPDGSAYAKIRISNKLGALDGEQTLFYPSGKKLAVVTYENKKAIKEDFFHESGKKVSAEEQTEFIKTYQKNYIHREFEIAMLEALITFRVKPSALISPTLSKEYRLTHKNIYLSKVKQAEAKIRLSALYTAEKAFYAEYGSYSTDLVSIGAYVDDKEPIYICGFARPYLGKITGISDHDPSRINESNLPRVNGNISLLKNVLANDFPSDTTATQHSFKVACIGRLSPGAKLDIWTIDDKKDLVNTQSGL